MAEPFLGEIRIMSFNFAPRNWAQCNGQFLPINQNQALFALLGTTYGGNGQTTFALPDFRGRVPIHVGQGHTLGERAGEQSHTLTINELPTHVHVPVASTTPGDTALGANHLLAPALNAYAPPSQLTPLAPNAVTTVGGSQAHLNMQPFLVLNFSIALIGIFPSQS